MINHQNVFQINGYGDVIVTYTLNLGTEPFVSVWQKNNSLLLLSMDEARSLAYMMKQVFADMKSDPKSRHNRLFHTESQGYIHIVGNGLDMGNAGDWWIAVPGVSFEKRIKGSFYLVEVADAIIKAISGDE